MASKRSEVLTVLTVAEAYRSHQEARGPRRVRMNNRSLQDLADALCNAAVPVGFGDHFPELAHGAARRDRPTQEVGFRNVLFGVPVEIDEGLGDGVLEWDMP